MNRLKKLCYNRAPIRSLSTLAEVLEVTELQLERLITEADSMYWSRPQKKKDGSLRQTWDAYSQLKRVHEFINRRILTKVQYPAYLQGGIKDFSSPRDYVRHVAFHTGSSRVVALDIADFFPSITQKQVYDIWRCFFRFSPEVASALTGLTTLNGFLPQGAKPSSYLANLVFWREEHNLVAKLEAVGWRYSRLIDDITISKIEACKSTEESKMLGMVINFVQSHGFRLKRKKLDFLKAHRQIRLNGLIANVKVSLPKSERSDIRKLTWVIAQQLKKHEFVETHEFNSAQGKLGKLKRFHPAEATLLKTCLPNKL